MVKSKVEELMLGNEKIHQVNNLIYLSSIITIDGGCCVNRTSEVCVLNTSALRKLPKY